MQKVSQIVFASIIVICCLNCNFNSETTASKNELQFSGEKSKLSAELFEQLDYQVKNVSEGAGSDWHKEQFQTLRQRTYQVKRRTSVKEESHTFPRFTVVEEVYETEDLAARRLERIQNKPQNLSAENDYYWIVTGFQNEKNVYFIQTDSALIGYYMEDFAGKLADAVKGAETRPSGSVSIVRITPHSLTVVFPPLFVILSHCTRRKAGFALKMKREVRRI